ncbi:MAG: hypothetical protein WC787_01585 [Patescibacteria group bacterium]|jgi:diadenosine tetraphosphate (Ap4A) HIT family hydrolase
MEKLIRHWDPDKKFKGAVLKVYDHWSLEVSWQQHTLGCYIIFCRREGVRLMSELLIDELDELKVLMRDTEAKFRERDDFRPDHFNYWQMGNALPLLHLHGIPRYETARPLSKELLGRDVTDPTWGHLPPWTNEKISREQMEKLHDLMIGVLGLKQPNIAERENPFYKGIREAIESA